MSICIAWIRNGKSYLIADTLVSSTENITLSSYTPFLQRKKQRNNYYVEEEGLKIYEISNEMSIAAAGNISAYSEIIDWIYTLIDIESFHRLIDLLKQNYAHLLKSIELIFLYKENKKNKIFVWDGNEFYEHKNVSKPIFIGCGAKHIKFREAVEQAIIENDDKNSHRYLALIIAYSQCLSMKLNTISKGFGGTFYGLFMKSKVQWMRDLEYVLLDKVGKVLQSISIIIREKSVIISSSMENTYILLTNIYTSGKWFRNYHNMKSVLRSVDTKEAFYYFYYGLRSNRIYLWEAKGILIRSDFRKWIRRREKAVDYLYGIDPNISDLIVSGKSKVLEPKGYILDTVGGKYIPFNKVAMDVMKQLRKIKVLDGYDFDFVTIDCSNFNKSHINVIRKNIEDFYNIVMIDYEFFCQKIIKENLDFYKNDDIDLTKMRLELILRHCLRNDTCVEYSKIKIVVVKDTNDYIINEFNITSWFETYHNCSFIIMDNKEKELKELVTYWIKEYYINERYFHLGMNILMADDENIGQILELMVPLERRSQRAADWILVRMNNHETTMPGGFDYVNEEWAFIDLLGLKIDYKLQQEIAITKREQELLLGEGRPGIQDWIENDSLFNHIIVIDPTK